MKIKAVILCVLLSLVSCKVTRDGIRSTDVEKILLTEMAGLIGVNVSNGTNQNIDWEEVIVYYSQPDSSGKQWKKKEVNRRVKSKTEDSTEVKICEVVQSVMKEREEMEVEEEEHTDGNFGYDIDIILFFVFVVLFMLIMCKRAP